MRGKGSPPRYSGIWTGITPAYAGKSLFQPTVFLRARDHPRVCGEKLTPRRSGSLNLGSPPRMRGKVIRCSICQRGSGITPAYAGKRHLVMDTSPLCRDHPRVCGEKFTKPVCKTLAEGSPPRMRGKAGKLIPFYVDEGITPAYAGKRRYHYMLCYPLWDHPRVCGEKCHSRLRAASAEGSPPRMRGKEAAGKLCPVGGGITPAYAGKRQSGELHLQQARDHPRICGEKPCAHIPAVCYIGSPPRMRGKVMRR